ncbi:ParA family protein [Kitasatospora sp. NPDC052868]|uniref:ParA family protein n=1 Tax=Kitasatospora sp. NPDC052868 TaxID=3364060 RepID=UPI0037C766D1
MIVWIFAGKGGIGKSTLSFLIAWLLGHIGRTLLIDADARQEDGSSSELYNQLTVDPVMDLATEDDAEKLAQLREVRGYRFVVVDNGPHRDRKRLEQGCRNGDITIVPLTLDYLEARAIMSSLREIVIPSGCKYRVVINKVPAVRKAKAQRTSQSLDLVRIPVFRTHMRALVAHQDAGQLGIPVTEGTLLTWKPAAEDARNLVDELLEDLGLQDRVPRPKPRPKSRPTKKKAKN